jgi:hypothetical protein
MNVRIEIGESGAITTTSIGEAVAGSASPIAAGPPRSSDAPERSGAIDAGAPSATLLAAVAAAGGFDPQPALVASDGVAVNAGPASY